MERDQGISLAVPCPARLTGVRRYALNENRMNDSAKKFPFLRFILLAGWGGAILWLSLDPAPPQPSMGPFAWDKFQHATAYGLLALLWGNFLVTYRHCRRRCWLMAFAGSVVFGALLEMAQGVLTTARSAEFGDLMADAVGAGAVSLAAAVWSARRMSLAFVVALTLLSGTQGAHAADNGGVGAFVSDEAVTLRDEAGEFLAAPFRTDNSAIWGTLAVAGAVGVTSLYDDDIRDEVRRSRGRTLDRATDAGNIVGHPLLHLGVAGAVWGGGLLADSPRWRDTGLMMGEAAVIADAATFVLKQSVGRARPLTGSGKGSFRPFQFESDFDSFPSMHTASSFAMASVLTRTSGSVTVGVLSYATAAFVGFSRMYDDRHWATDVLLGAAIGELAGRVVTNHYARKGSVAVVPSVSGSSAGLALVKKF